MTSTTTFEPLPHQVAAAAILNASGLLRMCGRVGMPMTIDVGLGKLPVQHGILNELCRDRRAHRDGLRVCAQVVRACVVGDVDVVVRMLTRDVRRVPRRYRRFDWFHEALRSACALGHAGVVERMLDDDVVVDTDDPARTSDDPSRPRIPCLTEAVRHDHADVVHVLLTRTTTIDPSHDDSHAVRSAARLGHARTVRALLRDARTDPSARNNEALQLAAEHGRACVVELLLADARTDPSALDNRAIRRACSHGHVDVVDALLRDARADPMCGHGAGSSPLYVAVAHGHARVVASLLRDARVDPSRYDGGGRWLLELACEQHDVDVASLLLTDARVHVTTHLCRFGFPWTRDPYGALDELLLRDARVRDALTPIPGVDGDVVDLWCSRANHHRVGTAHVSDQMVALASTLVDVSRYPVAGVSMSFPCRVSTTRADGRTVELSDSAFRAHVVLYRVRVVRVLADAVRRRLACRDVAGIVCEFCVGVSLDAYRVGVRGVGVL